MDRLRRALGALLPYGLVVVVAVPLGLWLNADVEGSRGGAALGFARPHALWLLALCPLLAWVGFHRRERQAASFSFSRVAELARAGRGSVAWLAASPAVLRLVAAALLVVALARPQTLRREEIEVEGIDIMLVLDLSRSMEERDLLRDRLDAAQRTIRRFLLGRKDDRIGLVVFGKEAMLQCPPTVDLRALDAIVASMGIGDVDPMGTAVGDALALAIASLRRSDARSRVVILLTDGDSNVVNEFDPEQPKDLAREVGVRVFTVLIGQESGAGPRFDLFGRQPYAVNPELLRRIARETGGRYLNAPDTRALDAGFEEVRATLEKSKHREVGTIHGELYARPLAAGLVLLLLEALLSLTRLRRFP